MHANCCMFHFSDGIMHYAPRVLLSRENLPSILRITSTKIVPNQQSFTKKTSRNVLRNNIRWSIVSTQISWGMLPTFSRICWPPTRFHGMFWPTSVWQEDTTSSSRIFIKILFHELSDHLGIRQLNKRLSDPKMKDYFDSIFLMDHPKNTRFWINFFTSIGLGGITETLREYLQTMPAMQQQKSESSSDESGRNPSKRRKM